MERIYYYDDGSVEHHYPDGRVEKTPAPHIYSDSPISVEQFHKFYNDLFEYKQICDTAVIAAAA
jgi:hypothetical protein